MSGQEGSKLGCSKQAAEECSHLSTAADSQEGLALSTFLDMASYIAASHTPTKADSMS